MLTLDPNRSGFTWANARACAERCRLCYTETQRTIEDAGIVASVAWSTQTDTQAFIFDEGDCLSIAFRGSVRLRDWLQDFKTAKRHPRGFLLRSVNGDGVEAHEGFMEDVNSVREDLSHAVANIIQPSVRARASVPIFVTGHSKGGAEAILFALELERQGYTVRAVYTFGQPRVGNPAFATIYDSTLYEETFRVVNQNDIVPRVPGVLMGYRHCGQEFFLPATGGWERNPTVGEKLLSDALGFWGAYRHKTDVLFGDHQISAYQIRIMMLI